MLTPPEVWAARKAKKNVKKLENKYEHVLH